MLDQPSGKGSNAAELRELAFYFGELQHQRLNIFLLAETILFAGAFAALDPRFSRARTALAVLALVVTGLLWRTLRRLQAIVDKADCKLCDADPLYKEISSDASSWFSSGVIPIH